MFPYDMNGIEYVYWYPGILERNSSLEQMGKLKNSEITQKESDISDMNSFTGYNRVHQ